MPAEDAIQSLRECLTRGLTGCLSSRSTGAYRVYLMQGDILAAHGPDDGIWIVRRLVNNGAITEVQGRQVIFYLGQGYRLEELLLDQVPDQLFLELLVERFRQNLLDFSFLTGPMDFEEMEAIFVDNIQVGHDSQALIRDLEHLRERIAPLRRELDTLKLRPGNTSPSSRREARIQDLCSPIVRLDELVVLSPFEEGPTLDLVRAMVASGVLSKEPLRSASPAPVEFGGSSSGSVASSGSSSSDSSGSTSSDSSDSTSSDSSGLTRSDSSEETAALGEAPSSAATPSSVIEGLLTEEPHAPSSAVLSAAIEHARELEERRQTARKHAKLDEEGITTSPVTDRVRQALSYSEDIGEDEIAMFEDHDVLRGRGQGQFSLEKKLLDRVDLGKPLVESSPPNERVDNELIEMEDAENIEESERASAFSFSFGPPPLDQLEQRRKISVCNDVLAELCLALDSRHGHGSGRAFVQLLIDGTPHEYKVLFVGAETSSSGRLNINRVIRNLQRRPESERRRLLNLGMLNLIERALSSGMEELDEETMDYMLQQIAGYQIRLGL